MESLLWFVSRGAGLVSLVLLTGAMVLGIANRNRLRIPGVPQFVALGLHRNLAVLSVVFLGVHIGSAVLDGYVPLSWVDAVVPFTSSYQTVLVGLGAIAVDLLLAVAITAGLRRRVGRRTWRTIHFAAYALWPIAMLHGLLMGPDTSTGLFFGVTFACTAAVVIATVWRLGWHHSSGGSTGGARAS